MLLLVLAGFRVLMVKDEVDLVGRTTLVGAEHNDVWGSVGELLKVKVLVLAEKLEVSSTTVEAIWEWLLELFANFIELIAYPAS